MPPRIQNTQFRIRRAFTLIELMVVIGIIVLLTAVTLPAVKALTQGNATAQSANLARTLLSNARTVAIAGGRRAALVFYEETSTNASPVHSGQTAAMVAVEDLNRSTYPGIFDDQIPFVAASGFVPQYFPNGIVVATLNDTTAGFRTSTSGGNNRSKCRTVVFEPNGQVTTGVKLCAVASGSAGTPTKIVGDWNFGAPAVNATPSVGTPGILLYNGVDLANQNYAAGTSGDANRNSWLAAHGDILVVNAYTGSIIR